MLKTSKWTIYLTVLISILLALAGCTNSNSTQNSSQQPAATAGSTPKAGGTLNIALSADPTTFDPSFSTAFFDRQPYQNIYDKLVDRDASGKIVPMLVEKWSISDDNKTYTFNLRQGVKFHDGTDFNAEAVKFTFERNMEKSSGRKSEMAVVSKVTVVDPNTVQIELKQPFSAFLSSLTDRSGMIVSPDAVKKYGKDFATHPVGTGPFMFKESTRGSTFVLDKNPNYWKKGFPKLDQVVYKIFPDPNIALVNLKSGAVDMITVFPTKEIANMKNDPKFQVINVAGQGFVGFEVNTTKPPFNKVELRQAVDLLIDRNAIVDVVLNGTGIPAHSPFVPSHFAYGDSDKALQPNLEKAKELLKTAGVPGGFTFTMKYVQTPMNQQLGQMIQSMLKPAGIIVNLESTDSAANNDNLNNRNFEAIISVWSGRSDPDQNIYDFFRTGGVLNRSTYSNQEVDKLLDEARLVVDEGKRKLIYDKAMKIINEELPFVFLYHPNNTIGYSKSIQGFKYISDGLIRAVDLSKN
ncbi:ABC transporter substrate-binding protein [Paenibacillus sp. GP183]|jgi:peptide/nickel transport system substrate-binding protein|uniref:ABC transporter substrate-binding protein n=1 Tax=Paenibacillus sp. GP183 TaxID=1882751 RepID=UPI000899BFC8|nr:ABC transporter substrate-binding protein [Paenibacillus sp. GP183]SEC41216.1 peptide/nickel transport system substrate-binding protein [Paenibacillus sp. GP183]